MPEDVRFDLTLFGEDGDSPIWGTASSYAITEASFGTGGFSHPRPYLQVPEDFLASKTDFLKGTSDIGSVTVTLLDVPQTATDQTTGIVTSEITELVGAEAILRRWYDSLSAWRTIFRGRVKSVKVNGTTLVEYTLVLDDPRAFEEEDLLFEFNETFSLYPQPGPIEDYGQFPSGEDYLLPAAAIAYTTFRRFNFDIARIFSPLLSGVTDDPNDESKAGVYYGVWRFDRDGDWNPNSETVGDETLASPYEVFVERIDRLKKQCDSDPTGVAVPSTATESSVGATRIPVFRGYVVRWRLDDESEWTYVRDCPNPFGIANAVVGAERERALLYMSSFDEDDLPPYNTIVQMQVLARYTTDETPYFCDKGTVGDILHAITEGELTRSPPRETYEAASLAAFRTSTPPGRFIAKKPENRRRWVQNNVYQAVLYAPCLTQLYELRPVSWVVPEDLSDAPFLAKESIEPVGDWGQQFSTAYNQVTGKVIVENVRSQEFIQRQRITWYQGIDESTLNPNLSPWERYEATETQLVLSVDSNTRGGPRSVEYSPGTLRTIGEVEGRTIGGDTEDTSAGLLANRYLEESRTRYIPDGAPRYQASCLMSDPVVRDAEPGDFLRVEAPWLPDRSTKLRNHVRYMQVFAISDRSPERRTLYLEDIGIPGFSEDNTSDPDDPTLDCVDNGTSLGLIFAGQAPDGRKLLALTADGEIHNDCPTALELDVLLLAGGGGGGWGDTVPSSAQAGGGGAAGGVEGGDEVVTITINAGETVTITVGEGGAAGVVGEGGQSGGATIIWVDENGNALDPETADPADAVRACGGGGGGAGLQSGEGVGKTGGSGGGSGAVGSPASSGGNGGTTADCDGDSTQGNGGGSSFGSSGFTSCNTASAGGGGAFGSAGASGADGAGLGGPGYGGDGVFLSKWNLTTGYGGGGARVRVEEVEDICPSLFQESGATYNGVGGIFGSGGGGGVVGDPQPGTDGLALLKYKGAAPSLPAPSGSAAQNSDNPQIVCVTVSEDDWPAAPDPTYRVRMDYAVAVSEPAAASGSWITGGYLDEPGTICTPELPSDATVWTRLVAESALAPPSAPSTPESTVTSQTPGLLTFALSPEGTTVTAIYNPNGSAGGIRWLGYVAPEGTPYDADDAAELAETSTEGGSYAVPLPLDQGDVLHLAAECWSGYAEGDPSAGVLLIDDFDRSDSDDIGDDWIEEASAPDTVEIVSGALEMSVQSTEARVYAADIEEDELFVQVRLSVNSTPTNLGVLARWDGTDGYLLYMHISGGTGGGLFEESAGAIGTTTGGEIPQGVEWVAQVWTKDDLQQAAWGPLADPAQEKAEATDATHNDRPGSVGVFLDSSVGVDVATVVEIQIFPTPFITVAELPTGWKAKVLDGSDDVVAEATESGGTATVDLQTYDHGNAYLPTGGYPKLVITDGSDVVQHTETGGIYPGVDLTYTDDGTLEGVFGTEGVTAVRSITYATASAASPSDVVGLLNRLMFDDDYHIMLDDDYNPLLADD